MYIYIYLYIYIYICFPVKALLVYFRNRDQDFPSYLTQVNSLDHRPHIWEKGISSF